MHAETHYFNPDHEWYVTSSNYYDLVCVCVWGGGLSFISNVRANIRTNNQKSEIPSVLSFTEHKQVFPFLRVTAIRRNNRTNATTTKKNIKIQQPKGELPMVNTLQSNLLIALQTQIWL